MKSSLALVALCVVLATAMQGVKADHNEDVEASKEIMRGLAVECKNKEGASDEDLENFIDDKMPETRTQKCLAGCLQEQFGISNGKEFQEDGFNEVAKMLMKGDEEKVKLAREIGNDCKDVKNDDRCELAVDIINCLKESAEKHGIELKH